jgi:predicted Zn-dependent protease
VKYIGLFILLIAFVIEAYARVRTKANTGIDIYWGQNESINVEVVLNSLAINDNDVQTITAASINQWNTYSNTKIYPDYVNSKTTAAKNTIEFVQVPNPYIGAGVVAVTTVNFSNLTGRIKSAQIYLNEKSGLNPAGYDFTTVPGSNPQIGQDIYLGDVLTHELGHYLGLGHSEVQDSTMIYTAYKNQYDLADEDIEAIESIYPTSTNYELKGRVIGGKQVPVFGASVKLISSKDGSVYASRISDEYGEFNFDGLQSVDNNYYIYIEPVKRLDAIPAYYTTVQTNFCPDDYVGTFFTDCSSANKGFPQKNLIKLNKSVC